MVRMARPGNAATHHCSISSRPSDTIEPHSGVGGTTPRPRKERPAKVMMALPTSSVTSTISGPIEFGMMWRIRMRAGLQTDHDGGLDVFLRALHDDEAARQTGELRPPHHQHGDDGVDGADAERGSDRQRQDDRRKAQHQIGDAHDQLFDLPARIGRNAADQRAEGGGDHDHDDAGEERDARTVEKAGRTRRGRARRCRANAGRRRPQALGDIDEIRRDSR